MDTASWTKAKGVVVHVQGFLAAVIRHPKGPASKSRGFTIRQGKTIFLEDWQSTSLHEGLQSNFENPWHIHTCVKDTSYTSAGNPHSLTNSKDHSIHTKVETSKMETNSDPDIVLATTIVKTAILKSWSRVWEISPPFQHQQPSTRDSLDTNYALFTTPGCRLLQKDGHYIPFISIPSIQSPFPFLFRDLTHWHLLQQDVHHLLC